MRSLGRLLLERGTLCGPAHSYLDEMRALFHVRGA